ncbi:hypothetical protein SADUNF_Sadunf01G0084600 [Salix dunnii]|uniref:Alpha N-terminal protein methyltransferase 1 n=1 Tax=Salix dunnii TaxID=1413687 RepID=A0A835NAK8_9ROSI|nr:hypothetical protein SADUNF_Sadunf01G0084600 [Salix dunnii]
MEQRLGAALCLLFEGSEGFLQTLLTELFVDGGIDRHLVALDCGSGIGRITKNLLIRYFNEVDLLEPVSHFLDAACESLLQENNMASNMHKATNFYCVPLQILNMLLVWRGKV